MAESISWFFLSFSSHHNDIKIFKYLWSIQSFHTNLVTLWKDQTKKRLWPRAVTSLGCFIWLKYFLHVQACRHAGVREWPLQQHGAACLAHWMARSYAMEKACSRSFASCHWSFFQESMFSATHAGSKWISESSVEPFRRQLLLMSASQGTSTMPGI